MYASCKLVIYFKKNKNTIATQIHSHLINNDIVDNFQSDNKVDHNYETALS